MKKLKVEYVFIASDNDHMINDFQKAMKKVSILFTFLVIRWRVSLQVCMFTGDFRQAQWVESSRRPCHPGTGWPLHRQLRVDVFALCDTRAPSFQQNRRVLVVPHNKSRRAVTSPRRISCSTETRSCFFYSFTICFVLQCPLLICLWTTVCFMNWSCKLNSNLAFTYMHNQL